MSTLNERALRTDARPAHSRPKGSRSRSGRPALQDRRGGAGGGKPPRIVRRASRLHGFGVFAAESINKNTRIIDYAGELIPNTRSAAREARYLKRGCIWVFRVNRAWSRDAGVGGNIARFINHSCAPNCWFEVDATTKTIWIRASRLIRPGEELTYDYATIGDHTIPCRCRPDCETML